MEECETCGMFKCLVCLDCTHKPPCSSQQESIPTSPTPTTIPPTDSEGPE